MEKIENLERVTKKLTVTTVSGVRIRGAKPETYTTKIQGRWKTKTAERWLRRNLMDPTITVVEVSTETHSYAVPADVFFEHAELIDNEESTK